jgi:hypothetical protein
MSAQKTSKKFLIFKIQTINMNWSVDKYEKLLVEPDSVQNF